MRHAIAVVLSLIAPVFARGDAPPDHHTRREITLRTRDILLRYCAECHTGSAEPGQSQLKLLDHGDVVGKKRPVPLAKPKVRSMLLELVKDGSMPPANRPGPTPEEVGVLEKWLAAGAPYYPEVFDERYVLETIAKDLDRAKVAKEAPARYVSFAHLVARGDRARDIVAPVALGEQHLHEAVRRGAVAAKTPLLTPLDPAATVFRFDAQKLGWLTDAPFVRIEKRVDVGAFRINPFDLLLLEYPHGQRLTDQDPLGQRLAPLLKSQLVPVPFVRGDELIRALQRRDSFLVFELAAAPTPLAKDMAALVEMSAPGGTDRDGPVAQPFATRDAVRTSFANGRNAIPPLSAWYAGDVLPEKPPFDLKAELVAEDKVVSKVRIDEKFKLRVSCDKQVHFTLLYVLATGDVRIQPVQGGTVIRANESQSLAPNAEGFSIGSILTGGDSAVEHLVLFASESELPVPTVVRSKHLDQYVWRFVFEPTERYPFDPNAVVRKVIPVTVTKK